MNAIQPILARTASADDTRALAGVVAEHARGGDLLLLVGDLGAGKTAFAQGFAVGLGIEELVTSPTFTLARAYEGRLVMNHLDVYRLDHLGEVADLALNELLDDGGVTLIEWGDAVLSVLPADYLEVRLELVDEGGDDDRRLSFRAVGRSWIGRVPHLTTVLEKWPC